MATQIIAAFRHHAPRLRGNTFLIATELAHRMNSQGYGRVAYRYLASKTHCCKQTAITHIAKLLRLGLIRRSRFLTKEGYGGICISIVAHASTVPLRQERRVVQRLDRLFHTPKREQKSCRSRRNWNGRRKGSGSIPLGVTSGPLPVRRLPG